MRHIDKDIANLANDLIRMSKAQENEPLVKLTLTQYEMGLLTGVISGVVDSEISIETLS